MFKNARYSVKHPLSLSISPKRHATTTIPLDGRRRKLLLDNQSSVEKKNRRGKNKDDPSKSQHTCIPEVITHRSLAKSNATKSACNCCRVIYTVKYSKITLSLPQNLALSL